MPSLNFTVFIDKVVDGSKCHTIRALRQRPFQAGDDLSFFTAMRKSCCRRLRPNSPCTAAVPILISSQPRQVRLGIGSRFYHDGFLSGEQVEELARRDGFATVDDFFRFFARGRFDFSGQLIEWRP
jgi:hypothetical protein